MDKREVTGMLRAQKPLQLTQVKSFFAAIEAIYFSYESLIGNKSPSAFHCLFKTHQWPPTIAIKLCCPYKHNSLHCPTHCIYYCISSSILFQFTTSNSFNNCTTTTCKGAISVHWPLVIIFSLLAQLSDGPDSKSHFRVAFSDPEAPTVSE